MVPLFEPQHRDDYGLEGVVGPGTTGPVVASIVYAKRVIFAIPSYQASRVSFSPALPSHRCQELQLYPMGRVIKTFTYYPSRLWKPALNGRVLSESDDTCANDIFDDSDPASAGGCILGFINADANGRFSQLSEADRRAALGAQYARVFDCPAMATPCNYKEKSWSSEPWVGGCYFGVPRPGALSVYGRKWRQPLADGRILFAGTEAANQWMGYMEGGFEAGERCATEALQSLLGVDKDKVPTSPQRVVKSERDPVSGTFANPRLPTVGQVLAVGGAIVAVAALAIAKATAVRLFGSSALVKSS